MFRLKFYAAMFAVIIGLLMTFNQTARAQACVTNPVVVNVLDAGAGSLRQAVIDACAGSTITFSDAGRGTISLTTGRIVIDKNLTLAGPGADLLTVRHGEAERRNNVIDVNSGVTAVISGLTISNGYAGGGGGIFNRGNLTVRNAVITKNNIFESGSGGGILSRGGTLALVNSIVTGNGNPYIGNSVGGGIALYGSTTTITDSMVSGNTADDGGGIYALDSSVSITNSTIGSNGSFYNGGGLYLNGGMATLTNCTVSQNSVGGGGGGIFIRSAALTLINTTVAGNKAGASFGYGGGIYNENGTVNARNSIIAGNIGFFDDIRFAADFDGTLTSQGYNLIGSSEGAQITGDTTGNIVGVEDARLGPLANNGGPTETHALLTGSPAINTGNTATSPAADQRGAPRVGTADIGAFELNNSSNGGAFVAQLPDGFVQKPYSYRVADFPVYKEYGNPDPALRYTYTVTGGVLPNGISLSTTFTVDGRDLRERQNVKFSGTTSQTGVFNFSVTATSNGSGFSFVTNYRLRIGNIPTAPTIAKAFAPASINVGGQSVVTLTLSNGNGIGTLTGASFTDTLSNMMAVGGAAGGTCAGASSNVLAAGATSLSLTNLTIPENGNCTVTFSVTSNTAGVHPNTTSGVTTTQTSAGASSNTANLTVIGPADLTVTKTHTGNFTQGDTGKTYSITVTNSGGTATSGLVSVADSLPNGLAATDINGTGWNCNFSNLTCQRLDSLAGGGSYPAITLTVNVAANAPGSVTNFASVSGGGETNTGNNQAADPTMINAAPRYSISGAVSYGITEAGQPNSTVAGVNMTATGSANTSALTDNSGSYFLSNLLGGNYTVTPSKTGDVRGINSLDATRIQQHLVGMTTLSANQLIAADTDGSGTVNSLDATRIQQRAVGIQTSNIIGQWKFVPGSRQYNSLNGNLSGENYQAVLVGEVSGNWATAASFAENSPNEEENEVLPETNNQNQTAERFANNPEGNLVEQIIENTKSSDWLFNQSPTEANAAAADIQVSLPTNAMGSNGSTVTIPITIGAIPAGSSIESFDFSVFYNAAVLQPAAPAGSNAGTLSANCLVLPNSPVSGRVIVSGACPQAITTGSGVLYNLTFNVIGSVNQTSSLSFTNPANNANTFQFNNGTPSAMTANGQFTVLGPTAASVSISGRVLTPNGRGLRGARVLLTDQNGNTRATMTTAFGYYRFDEVEVGQTYIFNVSSKRYSFAPQAVTVTEDLTELNFTAQ